MEFIDVFFLFIATHIMLGLLFLGSAENKRWVRWETDRSFQRKLGQKYSYLQLSKSNNWFSS